MEPAETAPYSLKMAVLATQTAAMLLTAVMAAASQLIWEFVLDVLSRAATMVFVTEPIQAADVRRTAVFRLVTAVVLARASCLMGHLIMKQLRTVQLIADQLQYALPT